MEKPWESRKSSKRNQKKKRKEKKRKEKKKALDWLGYGTEPSMIDWPRRALTSGL